MHQKHRKGRKEHQLQGGIVVEVWRKHRMCPMMDSLLGLGLNRSMRLRSVSSSGTWSKVSCTGAFPPDLIRRMRASPMLAATSLVTPVALS